MCTLKRLVADLRARPCSSSTMSGSPAAARNVGSQSWCWTISLETDAGRDVAGPADHLGHPERALPVGVLLAAERRHAAVGPGVHVRAVVGAVDDDRVVGDAQLVEQVEQLADVLVVVDHRVVVRRLPAPGLADALGLRCACAGACGWCSPSTKNGVPASCCPVDEVLAAATISSSMVSIRFLVSGPVSSMRCLPTRPVAPVDRSRRPSSVAQQWSTPRGRGSSWNCGNSSASG